MKPLLPFAVGLLGLAALPQGGEAPARAAVAESTACAACHSNAPGAAAMRSADGAGVAPYDLWRGTMMANSARDPLWRAVVSAEVAAAPSKREEIERTCLGCHAPLADRVGYDDHESGTWMHVLDCDARIGELARDGVSCTICHGIAPEGLGTEASFSAGFHMDRERRLFGPHERPFAMPMRRFTGFTPSHGAHLTDSALCGSCHTLETEVLDADGAATGGSFLEQAPYLEWLNSDFRDTSCQSCHVPTRDDEGAAIRTRIARNPMGRDFPPVRPREPFGRHVFVGGNALVLSILRDNAEELRVAAPADAIQRTLDATLEQLSERTATVSIAGVRAEDRALRFDVEVRNLTGHKLPTAHPTRRAWLRVVVRDARGEPVFASGETDERGRIVGADGRPLASELAGGPVEPHRDVVRSGDEVASYRAVMADAEGEPTHTLLRGADWIVDDRLLPRGWSGAHPEARRTAPVGVAGDDDFGPGVDRVRCEVEVPGPGPYTIEAELLYQTLSARWAAELFEWGTPEVEAFRRMYERADPGPVVLARDRWDG